MSIRIYWMSWSNSLRVLDFFHLKFRRLNLSFLYDLLSIFVLNSVFPPLLYNCHACSSHLLCLLQVDVILIILIIIRKPHLSHLVLDWVLQCSVPSLQLAVTAAYEEPTNSKHRRDDSGYPSYQLDNRVLLNHILIYVALFQLVTIRHEVSLHNCRRTVLMDRSPINLVQKVVMHNALATLCSSVNDLSVPTLRFTRTRLSVFWQFGSIAVLLVRALSHCEVYLVILTLGASVFVTPKESKMTTLLVHKLWCVSLDVIQ